MNLTTKAMVSSLPTVKESLMVVEPRGNSSIVSHISTSLEPQPHWYDSKFVALLNLVK